MRVGDLFEMSNLRKSETGLPCNIYVSSGGSVNKQHGPRIKVMRTSADRFDPSQTVSVMLKRDLTANDVIGYQTLDAATIKALRQYVNENFEVLIAHWNDELSSAEMLAQLKRI